MPPVHIPLDHPAVQRVREIIPARWHSQTWIAGSAAARWPEAWENGGDLDVWVCDVVGSSGRNQLMTHLRSLEGLPERDEDAQYAGAATNSWMVYREERLHVLVSMSHIQDVMRNFDISCHAQAVALDGQVMAGDGYREEVRILSWRDPARTLERALRFLKRYGQLDDVEFWQDPKTLGCMLAAARVSAPSCLTHTKLQEMFDQMVEEGL